MNSSQSLGADLLLRRNRLQSVMQKEHVEACILTSSVNIFYLTGEIYTGYLYIPADGELIHFVKRPVGLPFTDVVPIRKPEQIPGVLLERGISLPAIVLLETDVLPYSSCMRLLKMLGLREARNASVLLRSLRKVKTPYEIGQMKQCARQHVKVYEAVPSLFNPGMTDIELQIEVEHWMRKNGSLGIFRSYGENMDIHMGSLLAGENAAVPSPYDFALGGKGVSPVLPLGASGSLIREGQTVMVDMAGNYTPWVTDITRVYAFGKLPELAYRAHQVSVEIHQAVQEKARPGFSCSALFDIAMDLTVKNKLEPYFMGTRQQAKFVGHGLGLEINEPPVLTPRSEEKLEAGIVFALEPKYVIPGVGAVGIENTYLVTAEGVTKMTEVEEQIIPL